MKNNPHTCSEYLLDTAPMGLAGKKALATPLSQAPSWTKNPRESDVLTKPKAIWVEWPFMYQIWHYKYVLAREAGKGLVRMVQVLDEREQDWPPSTTALVKKSGINKTLKRKEVRIVTGQRKVKSRGPLNTEL